MRRSALAVFRCLKEVVDENALELGAVDSAHGKLFPAVEDYPGGGQAFDLGEVDKEAVVTPEEYAGGGSSVFAVESGI